MSRHCLQLHLSRHSFFWSLLVCIGCCGLIATAKGDDEADKGSAKTKSVKAGGITLKVPEAWKEKESTSSFRAAEIEVPGSGDDKTPGELVVFHFQGGGGGVQANVDRWIGQFESDGRNVKVFQGKSAQGEYTLVELTGTYKKPIGPPIQMRSKPMPGWRVLGVVLQTADGGPYFIKLDGPDKTIAGVANNFRASFGGNAKEEKEVKADSK
jgi:gluconolactonase